MIAVQATYDGKEFKPLLEEPFPEVEKEVSVTIVFGDEVVSEQQAERSQREIFEEMWAARSKMQPLGMSIREMIEEGRER